MLFRMMLVWCTALNLALGMWSLSRANTWSSLPSNQATTKSTVGKISAIGQGQFSLDTERDRKARTVQILIDQNTKVEGQLIVGAQVSVEYRTEGEKMVATRVVIMPAGGS